MSDASDLCGCCGESRRAEDLAALSCHPQTKLCRGCIQWLFVTSGRPISMPIFATLDMAASRSFYEAAGFGVDGYDDGYAFVTRGGGEVLHLAGSSVVDPARNSGACYLNTVEADQWHAMWSAAGLPVSDIADRPWGMREFEVTDPSGNLLRVGRNLA